MSINKVLKSLKSEDVVDSFVLPHRLGKSAKEKVDAVFLLELNKKRSAINETRKVELSLLKLKFQLEDYIKSKDYNGDYTFGYFLKNYLNILNKNNKDFADEIDVAQSTVNNWLKKNIVPNEEIFIRLEIHSNNSISAMSWLKVIEKTKERIVLDSELRQAQRVHVKKRLDFSF